MALVKHCQKRAEEMIEVINKILEKEKDVDTSVMLKGLEKTLSGLTGSRKNRFVLPFVGKLLNGLFGVAQEADLEREEERLDKIERWAADYGHVISEIVDNLIDHGNDIK